MSRLEFFKIPQAEIKDFLDAFVNGGEYVEKYTQDGEVKRKVRVNNNRIYLGNNLSLRVSLDETSKNYYFSLDYFTADDRINFKKKETVETTVV